MIHIMVYHFNYPFWDRNQTPIPFTIFPKSDQNQILDTTSINKKLLLFLFSPSNIFVPGFILDKLMFLKEKELEFGFVLKIDS